MALAERVTLGQATTTLLLTDSELELIHNLLSAGPRLGRGTTFREKASHLLDVIVDIRGDIEWEDRLFDTSDDFEGFTWLREEPYEPDMFEIEMVED